MPFQSGLVSIRLLKNSISITRNPKPAPRNSQLAIFLIITSALLLPSSIFSQDTIPRKKIGLVLSGGGAKGFAHIGVLKVLEQAGVKIDYIGGTSMGAVVGGLYASGYSATQIDSIFHNTNFDELLQDYIPRSSKSFYEKLNDEKYAISLPFNKFKIGIPVALSKGMYNYNMLAKLTHNVRHIRNFNQLPIPFICVATDIETGKEVLLRKGYLAQAMMASSAFPSLFSPVEIDGKILIDGGVTNNYPAEELRKMGAEIIIGVDVQDDLKDRESLKDATRILVQITNLEMINKMKEKTKITDIYIKPDISNYGVISFDEGKEIIKKGEEAAFAVYDQIKKLGTENEAQHLEKVDECLDVQGITISKMDNYTRSYVVGKLRFKAPKEINYDDLKTGINNLNATQNFSRISYSLEPKDNGDELKINLSENENKTLLKFGLHYDGLYKSAILVNVTHKKSVFKNDVLSIDLALGDNIRYNLDYYIDNGFYWSFGIKSRFNKFNRNVKTDFNDGALFEQTGLNSLNMDFSDLTNQIYVQSVFIQKYLIGAGLEHKYLRIETENLDDTDRIFENSTYISAFGYLKYDSFDNRYFPKNGLLFSGDIQTFLYSSDYTKEFKRFSIAKGEIGFAKNFAKKWTLKIQSEVGFKIGNESVDFFDFVLGGYGNLTINNFKHFFGYDFLSISADSYIKSCFTVDYEIYKRNHFNFSANYANLENNLFETGNWFSRPKFSGYAIGYGYESVVGPIEIKYTWSPELPKGYTMINVGFWF
ncbi:patatin-like phospholipase family protein [Flavobacterium macrobrachii]|uniref:Patatin-like phospholipase family protein n=1 Tax=Flavobacterium macrobrachii TaxID=591204 RepID=A0ABS2CZY6_9FLAO|nr:patatin-like phospholipase family protein [Flavobacterium macrobrachii]